MKDTLNDIKVAALKYVKSCSSQRTPRYIIMTKRYLREKDLLAVPFDKGNDICVMKRQTYISKLNDISNLEILNDAKSRSHVREKMEGVYT